jgi:hypothetical protein
MEGEFLYMEDCDRMVVVFIQSVPVATKVVSLNTAQSRCTRYNIMLLSLSLTCDRSEVFSMYSGFPQTDCHNITEILLKVALNSIPLTTNPNIHFYPSLLLPVHSNTNILQVLEIL